MTGLTVALRDISAVTFPTATMFEVADDNTVVIFDASSAGIGAVHPDVWLYVRVDGEAAP